MVYTDLLKKDVALVSCEKCHRYVEGHRGLLDQDVWVVLVSGDVGYPPPKLSLKQNILQQQHPAGYSGVGNSIDAREGMHCFHLSWISQAKSCHTFMHTKIYFYLSFL